MIQTLTIRDNGGDDARMPVHKLARKPNKVHELVCGVKSERWEINANTVIRTEIHASAEPSDS